MTKKEKRKFIILAGAVVLMFLGAIVILLHGMSAPGEDSKKGDIDKRTFVEQAKEECDAIYTARTEYKDQEFRVIFDSPQKNGTYWVKYVPFDEKSIDEYGDKEKYDLGVPVNTIIEEYLDKDEYNEKIGGREIFTASEDVTTIFATKTTQFEFEDVAYGYAETYVSAPGSETVESQVDRFAKDIINEDSIGIDAYQTELEGDEVQKYLSDNKFKKVN